MTIDKLPSGSYRIRHMENGKTYTLTVKHKPSKTEAMKLITERIRTLPVKADMTVMDACKAYLDVKHNVLSPSTRKEYAATATRLPNSFASLRLSQITSMHVQKVINDFAASLSPKTVANYAHFISAVLKSQDIDIKPPKLPQREKKSPYIPTTEDIKAIFDVIRDTEHEIPITLCCFGLRRSEVCALSIDDLDGNVLTIDKAVVKDEDNKWVIKQTKTTESTRTLIIPDDIADKIREKGYIYKYTPENLYKALQRAQDKAGVPHFQLHKLRHFFASYLHQKGYTDKQIQEMGGWKTDNVMKTVYQHAMDIDEAKQRATNDIAKLF